MCCCLIIEMVTGRNPTDDMFRDSEDLDRFSEAALPNRILEIADPTIWTHSRTYLQEAGFENVWSLKSFGSAYPAQSRNIKREH